MIEVRDLDENILFRGLHTDTRAITLMRLSHTVEWVDSSNKTCAREYVRWVALPEEERLRTIKYATLIKRLSIDSKMVSVRFKKWVLENCDCSTDLVPTDIMQRYLID